MSGCWFERGVAVTPSRRQFVQLGIGLAALSLTARPMQAQAYPSRPVRVIVGLPPGGVNDIVGRLVAQWLSDELGQPFVIENRPGASGNIAGTAVAKSPPDGYTLMLVGSQNPVNAALYQRTDFDLVRDITPVAGITRQPNVMVVNPSFPAKTVPEFVAYAKANAGRINMASTGSGTPSHVAGELFRMMTGAPMTHVPYRGGAPALTDLIGGQVQVYFGALASGLELIRSGKLRALAVTAAARLDVLPEIPAIAEFVPGYEASGLFGIGAPRGTPSEIISRLNRTINSGLADAKVKARLLELGGNVLVGSPDDFSKEITDEIEKWTRVVQFAGIKPE
jgi:tripartite-type tricarboxylate transporter receptor subunit TctC